MASLQRIVGVGASAGGLEALEKFFAPADPKTPYAFVVVQHLSPDHKSLMADILGKATRLPVHVAEQGLTVEAGHIYLNTPRSVVTLKDGKLELVDRLRDQGPHLPIDTLFQSLAEQSGEDAIGVVLSGTGSDGRLGAEAIKAAGGYVLAQDPPTARFDGMPQSAIATGMVDLILAPEGMQAALHRYLEADPVAPAIAPTPEAAASLVRILEVLQRNCGVNFNEYKQGTLRRRLFRRMTALGLTDLDEYARLVTNSAEEAHLLSRELLINVTNFFRDTDAFNAVREKALLPLIQQSAPRSTLRLWIAGCSSGQEAYSLAITALEAVHLSGKALTVKVFATDVDTEALELAGAGRYAEGEVQNVPEALLKKYFTRQGQYWVASRELRKHILFVAHNLAKDPPFTRIDLMSCRNLLIYFSPPLQRRVLHSLTFALKAGGYLFLGPSETLGDSSARFQPVDPVWKVFKKVTQERLVMPTTGASFRDVARPTRDQAPSEDQLAIERAFQLLVNEVAAAAVLTTENLELLSVFGNASAVITVRPGVATLNLAELVPSHVATVLTLAAHRALATMTEASFAVTDEARRLRAVRCVPLTTGKGGRRFLVCIFEREALPHAGPSTEPLSEEATRRVSELQDELRFVRESLQTTIEELETSNEELQATNEELLAANEELQSTNEELHSVNQELGTVNAEHQSKITELTNLNADLDNLFKATSVGTLFLDAELVIRRFTASTMAYFKILERDVGRNLEDLTARFDDPAFITDLRRCAAIGASLEREVTTTDGRVALFRVSPYLGPSRVRDGVVVTFVDISSLRAAIEQGHRLRAIIEGVPHPLCQVNANGLVVLANPAWRAAPLAQEGENLATAAQSSEALREALLAVLHGAREVTTPAPPPSFEVRALDGPEGGAVVTRLEA